MLQEKLNPRVIVCRKSPPYRMWYCRKSHTNDGSVAGKAHPQGCGCRKSSSQGLKEKPTPRARVLVLQEEPTPMLEVLQEVSGPLPELPRLQPQTGRAAAQLMMLAE